MFIALSCSHKTKQPIKYSINGVGSRLQFNIALSFNLFLSGYRHKILHNVAVKAQRQVYKNRNLKINTSCYLDLLKQKAPVISE